VKATTAVIRHTTATSKMPLKNDFIPPPERN
jgi:hypothetical protein